MEYFGRPGAGSAISTSPLVTSSSPPRMRSSVVLPQPEGPTIAKKVPSSMSSETSSMAVSERKRLIRCWIRIFTARRGGAAHSPAAVMRPLST